MKNKAKTTCEEFIENEEQKFLLDKEYQDLLVSELLIAAMEQDQLSVRKLASVAGVSPTVIQGLKWGSRTNVSVNTLSRVLDAVDSQIAFIPKSGSGRRARRGCVAQMLTEGQLPER